MGVRDTLSFGPVLLRNGELGQQVADGKFSSDEPRCATQVADVLQSMENVTGKVTQAITGLDGPAARRPSPRRATR